MVNLDIGQIKEGFKYKTKFSFYLVGTGQALKVFEQEINLIKAVTMRTF